PSTTNPAPVIALPTGSAASTTTGTTTTTANTNSAPTTAPIASSSNAANDGDSDDDDDDIQIVSVRTSASLAITNSKVIQSMGNAFIRMQNVPGDGNCGFRVLAEGMRAVNHQFWRRFESGQLGALRPRQSNFHIPVRKEIANWFEQHKNHYMGRQDLLPQSGAVTGGFSSLLAGIKGPGHRDNRTTWFSIPLHAQIFADRFRFILVLLPFPSAP